MNAMRRCYFCDLKVIEMGYDGMMHRLLTIRCRSCGTYRVGEWLPGKLTDSGRALVAGVLRQRKDAQISTTISSAADLDSLLLEAPDTFQGRLDACLAYFVRKTQCLGEPLEINLEEDFPIAYARSRSEFGNMLEFLREQELIKLNCSGQSIDLDAANSLEPVWCVTVTPRGLLQGERRRPTGTRIFLSSTCYDLRDVRAELMHALFSDGHIPVASDREQFEHIPDVHDSFAIDGLEDSLKTCLRNLETCTMVFVILDKSYGRLLPDDLGVVKELCEKAKLPTVSATHLEVLHARQKNIPVFTFIRKETLREYHRLRRDPATATEWTVWPGKPETTKKCRESWLAMIKELIYPEDDKGNWMVEFESIVDLRRMVLNRVNSRR